MAYFSRPQSTAVKIVNPNTQEEFKSQTRKDSVQRQCRNIMIYGSCRYQDKGCVYYHPPGSEEASETRSDTPTIAPLAQAVNAPVFVPKSSVSRPPAPASPPPMSISRQSSVTSPSPPSPEVQTDFPHYRVEGTYDNFPYSGDAVDELSAQLDGLGTGYMDDSQYSSYPADYDSGSLDPSFYPGSTSVFPRQPLDYHLYTTTIPPAFLASAKDNHFIPPSSTLRQTLQSRSEIVRASPPLGINLPEDLQGYHSLAPLEEYGPHGTRRKFGSWQSTVYRAINSSDGTAYVLRRIENFRLTNKSAFEPIEAWSNLTHPGVALVKEAFTTRAFGDDSLVVVYAYYPNARTLLQAHFFPKYQPPWPPTHSVAPPPSQAKPLSERIMWSYLVQLASAIKRIHEAGLAARTIDVTKVLLTGQNRVRISSCGVVDVLIYDTPRDITLDQQEDLTALGRMMLILACNSVHACSTQQFTKSVEHMGRFYSHDFKRAMVYLLNKNSHARTIDQFFDLIPTKVVAELDEALVATDRLEHELMGELENARLVRLLCKFGFINERPEFARDSRWSETGDRYIIKLFRDYVFHQVDENNNPVVNLSHVLTCLNKLDAGVDEKILLVARDEQSCLVVSYKEIKSCIDSAFSELSRPSGNQQRQQHQPIGSAYNNR